MKDINNATHGRRKAMNMLALGSTGLFGLFDSAKARAERCETPAYQKGAQPVTVTRVRAITTAPGGSNLVIVKVETSEPGYGLNDGGIIKPWHNSI